MIVGVAQLVDNVADLDAAAAPLRGAGLEETFRAEGLANHEAKRPFQARPRAALDMVHLAAPGRTAIELTRYHGDPPAGATVLRREADHVAVAACAPDASAAFWEALGFRRAGDGPRFEARAALPAWQLSVVLEPAEPPAGPTSVDADGCVLVTVLTTGIEAELTRLGGTGLVLRSTAAWSERIGDRTPKVAIVEGPSGELVELLEAPRRPER